MNRTLPRLAIICGSTILVMAFLAAGACTPSRPVVEVGPAPATAVNEVVDVLHGVEVADPYRWLEDQEAAETREWIDAQNVYADSIFEQLPGREELTELVTGLVKTDVIGTPMPRDGHYFFSRRMADEELSVIYVREGLEGEDRILVDPHGMSDDNTTSVSIVDASDDGAYLIYSVRQGGKDETEMRVLDVASGEDLPDVLPASRYFGATLSPDSSTLFYTRFGEEGSRVMRHVMGEPVAEDEIIFGESYGPDRIIWVALSHDGRWLTAHVIHGSSGPVALFLKDLESDGPWQTVIDDGVSHSSGSVVAGRLIVKTDLEAPNGRVMVADPGAPSVEDWQVLIPEQEGAVLEGVEAVGGHLMAEYLEDVHSKLAVYDLGGNLVRDVNLDTLGSLGYALRGTWESDEVFFSFSSFNLPSTVYRYDIATGDRTVWAAVSVPLDTSQMVLKQVRYTSADGTEVPMFILHKQGVKLDGANPTLLEGYGGFNANMTPYFSYRAAAWVDGGGVFAMANLRGGGELGEEWHQAGMMERKQNTFDDFIAAAEWLIDNDYTNPAQIGVRGGSNGGLLVGAVANQRPDLFAAVICTYPLLDMLRYHQFLVGAYWVSEYGSADDPEQFDYIYRYSPYHNVPEGAIYPATLLVTGDGDTRVAPLHARKMAALLQASFGESTPIMLRYHTKAGHSGGMPTSQVIEDTVEVMSFLRWQLGGE